MLSAARALLTLALLAAGCRPASPPAASTPDLAPVTPDSRPAPDQGNPACRRIGRQTVKLTTDDGVPLEADLYRTAETGGPAAVLVHEAPPLHPGAPRGGARTGAPPRYDRRRYPERFIDALLLRGVSVLNLDGQGTRGSGASGGVALEAYRGPRGWLDVKAARDFLAGYPCPIDATRLACVGASNGSTSCLDYAVNAAARKLPGPRALVLLTGGRYTEAQHRLSAVRELPVLLVTSTAEAAWSRARAGKGAPPSWKLLEYRGPGRGEGHGTAIFKARPASIEKVADFVAGAVRR